MVVMVMREWWCVLSVWWGGCGTRDVSSVAMEGKGEKKRKGVKKRARVVP